MRSVIRHSEANCGSVAADKEPRLPALIARSNLLAGQPACHPAQAFERRRARLELADACVRPPRTRSEIDSPRWAPYIEDNSRIAPCEPSDVASHTAAVWVSSEMSNSKPRPGVSARCWGCATPARRRVTTGRSSGNPVWSCSSRARGRRRRHSPGGTTPAMPRAHGRTEPPAPSHGRDARGARPPGEVAQEPGGKTGAGTPW